MWFSFRQLKQTWFVATLLNSTALGGVVPWGVYCIPPSGSLGCFSTASHPRVGREAPRNACLDYLSLGPWPNQTWALPDICDRCYLARMFSQTWLFLLDQAVSNFHLCASNLRALPKRGLWQNKLTMEPECQHLWWALIDGQCGWPESSLCSRV